MDFPFLFEVEYSKSENCIIMEKQKRNYILFVVLVMVLATLILLRPVFKEIYDKQKEKQNRIENLDKVARDIIYLSNSPYEKDINELKLTDSFLETRCSVYKLVNKITNEPYKKEVQVENIWDGSLYSVGHDGKRRLSEENIEVQIESSEIISDSTANIMLSYSRSNDGKVQNKKVVLVYDYDKHHWLIDDLLYEGISQKDKDMQFCQEIQSRIDDYYKNWRFTWQRKTLVPSEGYEIPALTENRKWQFIRKRIPVIDENEKWYKTKYGFVRKGTVAVEGTSIFEIRDTGNVWLNLFLQSPDTAIIRFNNGKELCEYKGNFSTTGAKFSFYCDSLEKRITGKFEDPYTITFEESSSKEIGWNSNKMEATSPYKNQEESSIRSSNFENCWFCNGRGVAYIPPKGFVSCPKCLGQGLLKDDKNYMEVLMSGGIWNEE